MLGYLLTAVKTAMDNQETAVFHTPLVKAAVYATGWVRVGASLMEAQPEIV
jgi:hypothetical protein